MATTTPNFGWDIPQSTDLVKDGATAIAALGTDIDTALVDLKGGTTGQVLSKNSNTDLDFTWVAQDDSNAIQNAIVDAKGDLISATAADTPARLAVGTNGQVLTADSTTATGLKWATPATALTWTQRVIAGGQIRTIAYNGTNLYVAAGSSGALVTSPDGITWTSRTSGFGANVIRKVAFGNGLWVAVGENGTLTTSSDGITWTARTANMSTNQIEDVQYANSIWVAVGGGGGTTNTGGITYSTDGITWTRKSQSITVGAQYNMASYNGTNWIVVASFSTNNYLYASTPSGTWTAGTDGSGTELRYIFWDGTRNIVVESSGGANYSTSTTLGTTTAFSGESLRSTSGQYNFYLNQNIYSVGAAIAATGTAPVTGQTPNQSFISISPSTRLNASGALSDIAASIWVGTAGYIVGDDGGRIYTSF